MFNRLALILDDEFLSSAGVSVDVFSSYQAGGLLNQIRPPIVKEYRSLAETLETTAVPQMLRGEEWEAGKGIDIHLSIAAVLDFLLCFSVACNCKQFLPVDTWHNAASFSNPQLEQQ